MPSVLAGYAGTHMNMHMHSMHCHLCWSQSREYGTGVQSSGVPCVEICRCGDVESRVAAVWIARLSMHSSAVEERDSSVRASCARSFVVCVCVCVCVFVCARVCVCRVPLDRSSDATRVRGEAEVGSQVCAGGSQRGTCADRRQRGRPQRDLKRDQSEINQRPRERLRSGVRVRAVTCMSTVSRIEQLSRDARGVRCSTSVVRGSGWKIS